MSHYFVGDLHGCHELGPLEFSSYTPLVAAHWNMAISATDHCVSISATKTGRLEGGGDEQVWEWVCFLVKVRRKALPKVHEVQAQRTGVGGKLVFLVNNLQNYEGCSLIGCPNLCTQKIRKSNCCTIQHNKIFKTRYVNRLEKVCGMTSCIE